MRRASFALIVLTLVSLVVGVTGCTPSLPQIAQSIKIGLITELTGDGAAIGQSARNAVELAVKGINDAGGAEVSLKKYPIELVGADSQGREELAIAAAQKLISQDGVLAIIDVDRSQVATADSWIAENTKTVLIGPGVVSPDFTIDPKTKQAKKYVFRMSNNADFQGASLAKFALTQLGSRKAAVHYDSVSDFNRSVAESFKKAFAEGVGDDIVFTVVDGAPISPIQSFAGDVVAFENYKIGDKDFTSHAGAGAREREQSGPGGRA